MLYGTRDDGILTRVKRDIAVSTNEQLITRNREEVGMGGMCLDPAGLWPNRLDFKVFRSQKQQ